MKTKQHTAGRRNPAKTSRAGKPRRLDLGIQRAEAPLGANEQRLQHIFDSAPVSIWEEDFSEVKRALEKLRAQGVTDIRSYLHDHPEFVWNAAEMVTVIDVNDATVRLFEADNKSELLGTLKKSLTPEALPAFCDELIAIAEGRPFFEGEIPDRTMRGKPLRLWRTIVFPKENAKFNSVLVSLTDITGQKQAEEDLKRSYSLLNATLESTADGILVVAKDGKVTRYNAKLLALWGIPESLAAQKDDRVLLEFVLGQLKDPAAFLSKVEALYQSPETTSFDELEFSDGRIMERYSQPQRLGETIIGRVWSFREVTEQKRAEKALRESEARLLTVLESSPIPTSLSSLEEGVILYGNSALERLLGVPLSEAAGQQAVNFYADPADRSRLLEELERIGFLRDHEVRLRRTDGAEVWVSLSGERIVMDGQACLLSCFYDISGRKQAEALQAAIYQISEAANNVISLGQLFRSVHEIVSRVMLAQNFYIALYDSERDLLGFPYFVDEVDGSEAIPATKPGRGMTEYLIRTGKPLLSDAANFEELARQGEVELVGAPSPIWIGAPLIVEGRTIGAIALQDYHNPNAYTERELRMLEYVSGQVAKAIERTRLYADIQRTNRILSALQEATLPLIKQTELSEVLQEILKQTTELFETSDGYIYFVKPDKSEIVLSMGIGPSSQYIGARLQIGEGLAGKVWEADKPLSVDDYDTWPGRARVFDGMKFHASAAVPLTSKSKLIGVLGIGSLTRDHRFDSDDLELLTHFAELASIAIENATLYTRVQQELAERTMAQDALRKAEAKYRELVERLPVVVYTSELGASGAWQYVSPQIESLLGFTPQEWMADPNIWYRQVHPADRETQQALEEQTYASGGRTFDSQYRIYARDGREVWVRDTAYILPPQGNGLPIVQGVLVDITQRMQAEGLQSAIYQISDAVYSSASMEDFYRAIQRSLQRVMTADNFFIALYDKETDLLSFPYYVDENDPIPNTAPLGRGSTAYVIRHGAPLWGRSDAMQKLEEEGELVPAGTRSMDWLGVPLKIKNETVGVMAVQTYAEGIRYSQRDLDILNFVSTQVALSIERKQAGESLRAAEARYRTLVEQLPVVVYVNPANDATFTTYVSPQIKDFLGYTQEEWLQDPKFWEKALHPEDRSRALAEAEKLWHGVDSFDEEYRLLARDGHAVWVRDQATLLTDANGHPLIWQGVMIDISERKQAEEHIRRQVERLKALRTIDMFIASGTDLRLTLQTILTQAVSQLRVDAADILLLNSSMHALEFAEGVGFRTRLIEQSSLRVGEGTAGHVALEREMVASQDLSSFVRQPLIAAEAFTSYVGMPLIAKGEVKGVLEIFHRSPIHKDPEWMDFLESLAGQAALAIDNASLFDSLQRSNLELGMAYETTLEGWSAALDLRDKETEGHTRRVTDLTLKLAEAMGLSERERVHMRRGALLHDIGKMGIPDRILLKPDQLTDEEWEIMRQHPTYAYNLLSPIGHLRPALDIPYCHHEKWDGTGYPRRLRGAVIPLPARIFAVADVWDALLSDRPYRPAWTKEKALEHIQSLSGVHFDPNVVEVFLQVVGQG